MPSRACPFVADSLAGLFIKVGLLRVADRSWGLGMEEAIVKSCIQLVPCFRCWPAVVGRKLQDLSISSYRTLSHHLNTYTLA